MVILNSSYCPCHASRGAPLWALRMSWRAAALHVIQFGEDVISLATSRTIRRWGYMILQENWKESKSECRKTEFLDATSRLKIPVFSTDQVWMVSSCRSSCSKSRLPAVCPATIPPPQRHLVGFANAQIALQLILRRRRQRKRLKDLGD